MPPVDAPPDPAADAVAALKKIGMDEDWIQTQAQKYSPKRVRRVITEAQRRLKGKVNRSVAGYARRALEEGWWMEPAPRDPAAEEQKATMEAEADYDRRITKAAEKSLRLAEAQQKRKQPAAVKILNLEKDGAEMTREEIAKTVDTQKTHAAAAKQKANELAIDESSVQKAAPPLGPRELKEKALAISAAEKRWRNSKEARKENEASERERSAEDLRHKFDGWAAKSAASAAAPSPETMPQDASLTPPPPATEPA